MSQIRFKGIMMPPSARWDDTHPNVIVLEMVKGITWDEINAVFDQELAMAREKGERVAVIMDVRATPEPPSSDTIAHARQLFVVQPRNVVLWVLVGGNTLAEIIVSVLRNARVVKMLTSASMEAAYDLIDKEFKRLEQQASAQ